jgi:hypothetical protein
MDLECDRFGDRVDIVGVEASDHDPPRSRLSTTAISKRAMAGVSCDGAPVSADTRHHRRRDCCARNKCTSGACTPARSWNRVRGKTSVLNIGTSQKPEVKAVPLRER